MVASDREESVGLFLNGLLDILSGQLIEPQPPFPALRLGRQLRLLDATEDGAWTTLEDFGPLGSCLTYGVFGSSGVRH